MTERRFDTLPAGLAHGHPDPLSGARYSAVELLPNCSVLLLDQRLLPVQEKYEVLARPEHVADAITKMMVRGAPAIGITAAYGMVNAAWCERGDQSRFIEEMDRAEKLLLATRPTAVNLAWALRRMRRIWMHSAPKSHASRVDDMARAARDIHKEDVAACKAMGVIGAAHVPDDACIITHCNAGALATGGYGTALGVIRAAREAGKVVRVLAGETRPWLQGARLTAWELAKDGIDVTVITDSMVAHFMKKEKIACVVVGADRIARNGDVANKIGTYGLACLAKAHGIPFYVAAPTSTLDMDTENGEGIVIEQRSEREMTHVAGTDVRVIPELVHARNPAFDVTPHELVTAIFTEVGEAPGLKPFEPALRAFVLEASQRRGDALDS
jgi:methylthioribose-1-phosphate isomerase